MKTANATASILSHLKRGRTITALQALEKFGCMRLGARILELRERGHDITSETVTLPNGKRVSKYRIRKERV